jgi:nicotinate phosphoribosyltransferase
LPGPKQVFRYRDPEGNYLRDVIARAGERFDGGEGLLGEVMRDGKRLRPDPSLDELRSRFRAEFACLPEPLKALRAPAAYDVRTSEGLEQLRRRVVRETTERELGGHPAPSGTQ